MRMRSGNGEHLCEDKEEGGSEHGDTLCSSEINYLPQNSKLLTAGKLRTGPGWRKSGKRAKDKDGGDAREGEYL